MNGYPKIIVCPTTGVIAVAHSERDERDFRWCMYVGIVLAAAIVASVIVLVDSF